MGVFWDFMSLHQHPPGGSRTPVEDRLFKRALEGLGDIYSHAATTTFMLTTFPADYPAGYELPDGANVNEYFERGWCFFESSIASLVKPTGLLLDLGKMPEKGLVSRFGIIKKCATGVRRPPQRWQPEAICKEKKGPACGREVATSPSLKSNWGLRAVKPTSLRSTPNHKPRGRPPARGDCNLEKVPPFKAY